MGDGEGDGERKKRRGGQSREEASGKKWERKKKDSPQGTSTMTGRVKRETSTVFVVELNPG